jgi:DNA-binding beta-propeller fold protein YncE
MVAIAGVILFRLIHIGQPRTGGGVQFIGFVPLPSRGVLTVLDYLTVSDRQLFVADETSGAVYKIALDRKALPTEADVSVFPSEPVAHGVALNSSRTMAYVTRSEVNAVDVFDPNTLQAIARIPVAQDPDAIVLEPLHRLLYVTHGDAHQATLIDPESRLIEGIIQLPGRPEFAAFDRQSGLMYQNLEDIDAVAAVDVTTRSVKDRWPLPGCDRPSGIAIDEQGRRALIVCAGNARMVVFALETHRLVASVPIGGGPDSVAFDPASRRIYTTGKSGVLTVIQRVTPDTYTVVGSVKLHYGAHTLALDPVTHNVYVGYASLFVPARIAVFSSAPSYQHGNITSGAQ